MRYSLHRNGLLVGTGRPPPESESGVIELMECVNAVRPRLWRGRGRDLPGPVAYIDVDGTLAPTLGRKKAGMDQSHKKVLKPGQ